MEVSRPGREKGGGDMPSSPEGTEFQGALCLGLCALRLQCQMGIFVEAGR